MRRLALLAAVLAVSACNCDGGDDDAPPVDTTPPAPPVVTGPADGAAIPSADVTFTGTAEAGATVEVQIDGTARGTAVASGDGSWSIAVTGIAEGTRSIRARAIDAAGNASDLSAARSLRVDTTAPGAPAIDVPAEGAPIAAKDLQGGKVVFSGTADLDVTLVELEVGTQTVTDVATAGSWMILVTLVDGTDYSAHARATDAVGNVSGWSATRTFSVDTTPPLVPAIEAPTPGQALSRANLVGGNVVFSGTTDAGATVEVQVDGAAAATATVTGTAWSYAAPLADEPHTVSARAKDALGNASAWTTPVSFTLDATAPAIPAVLVPQDGATLQASDLVGGKVVFSGTAETGATVDLLVDDAAAGSAVAGADRAWSVPVLLENGAHAVRARATDAVGNASTYSTAVAFTVDATRLAFPLVNPSPVPVTSWGQGVPVTVNDRSGLGEMFPGQANSWSLGPDFSLSVGYGQAYHDALLLFTGTPTGLTHGEILSDVTTQVLDQFPGASPLSAAEAVYLTPLFGATDGVVTAAAAAGIPNAPAINGTSAYLNGTSDSRLTRVLALTPGQTHTFRWTHRAVLLRGNLIGASAPSYQVVLRDPAGNAIGAPLFTSATDVLLATETVTRDGLPAEVVLSFELRSAALGYVAIDEVTLAEGAGPAVTIGDFETGLGAWQPNGGAESQNVRSGARDVGAGASALRITRTFYAPPAATWGRMVDVFENGGAAPVTTSAVYVTSLWGALPVAAVSWTGAVVGWDAATTNPVRDVGIVFGNGPEPGTALVADGDPFVFVVHDLTVAPGGKVALVHFVVQLGEAAGGPTSVDVPLATDQECGRILAGFPALEELRIDLEPGVLGRIANF
ncbi:MAG TPA: Ig-like domain-containing protein [Anaeromyxobacter sp.]|nr:Ig-like domain-containing protein [Anaeromyxobacter sp.]